MTQKSIKYHIIVRHLFNFEKEHRKTTYTALFHPMTIWMTPSLN